MISKLKLEEMTPAEAAQHYCHMFCMRMIEEVVRLGNLNSEEILELYNTYRDGLIEIANSYKTESKN